METNPRRDTIRCLVLGVLSCEFVELVDEQTEE